MKKSLILLGVLSMATAYAQEGRVGINTENPNATLEVAGVPTNTKVLDGIIAPRITGDQLKAKTYTADQTGALVYVTEPATTANQTGQTINVAGAGYYYFDGSVWQIFKAGDTDTNNLYTAGAGIAISNDNVISRTGFESVGTGSNRGWRLLDTNTRTPGKGSVDMMANNTGDQGVTGEYSVVGGYNNNVSSDFCAVFGNENNSNASDNSLVVGTENTVEESESVLVSGNGNKVSYSYYSVVGGISNESISLSHNSAVFGYGNVLEEAEASFVSGERNKLFGSYAYVFGKNNVVSSGYSYSMVVGNANELKENTDSSIIMGGNNKSYSSYSIVLGEKNEVYNDSEITLGSYNFNTDAGNSDFDMSNRREINYKRDNFQFFTLGAGSHNVRRNAIIVLRNANTGIGLASDTTTPANSKPTEMLDVNGNVRVRGENKAIKEGVTCTNEGTITYSNQSFYGCAGNVWKKLHN